MKRTLVTALLLPFFLLTAAALAAKPQPCLCPLRLQPQWQRKV